MVPIQLFTNFNKFQRSVRISGARIFLGLRNIGDFSASPDLIWFYMDNFESSELPGLAQLLPFLGASYILVLH